jgi:ATP-dependent Clp protease ATP-binding subunit ClpC
VIEIDILEAIGDIVGVKMSRLDKNKVSFLQNMPVEIKKSVIGQDEVIDKICKNITRNKLGLRKSAHSMGNFIFIGSTGVGKTHLAKQIARYLYGSEDNLLRFDMSEYQSEIDVSKLLGSAPGYVGYKESGLLVKRLAKYPESVVLFDEIEKAHPKIYDVLLQLLDEGFITGSDGNKVDATKSLIIFTSNVGVRSAKQFSSPIGYSNDMDSVKNKHREDIIRKALNKRFSPEFLNRLDNICYFNNLDRDTLKSILHKEIKDMNENIKTICGKSVELTEEVETWILDKVETEENGARPIIRHLQQNIEEELSTMIIEDNKILKSNKKTLKAYIKNDKIILK